MYNLFLDDVRYPYLDPLDYIGKKVLDVIDFVSAYHYTKYEPLKSEHWLIVRNYDDFVSVISKKGLPISISFDHDLADNHYPTKDNMNNPIEYDKFEEKTGYDCAKWLCQYCQDNNLKFPSYYIHSMNPVGKVNIDSYITNYKKHIENAI